MLGHVFRSFAEPIINQALATDLESRHRLQQVESKCIRIDVKELPMPLVMQFSQGVVTLLGRGYEALDASVTLSLTDIPTLQDRAQATQAIQSGTIQVTGDPLLLQYASEVFTGLEIDWEVWLADYVGDVPAYVIGQKITALEAFLKQLDFKAAVDVCIKNKSSFIAKATPSQAQWQGYQEQVKAFQHGVDALEKRLAQLEK